MAVVWFVVPAVTILAVYVAASLVAMSSSGGELAARIADVGWWVCAGGLSAALLVLLVERGL